MGTDASTVDFKNRRSWLEKSSEILTEPSSANMKKAESKHLKAYNRKCNHHEITIIILPFIDAAHKTK